MEGCGEGPSANCFNFTKIIAELDESKGVGKMKSYEDALNSKFVFAWESVNFYTV